VLVLPSASANLVLVLVRNSLAKRRLDALPCTCLAYSLCRQEQGRGIGAVLTEILHLYL